MEPTYVTFEQAKLLKEKGFDLVCTMRYNELRELAATKLGMHGNPNNYSGSYSAPEQWQVVEWLFDKHDIDVSVYGKLPYVIFPDSEYGEGELQWHFEYRIIQNKDGQKCEVIEPKEWFDSKQQAYLAAFDYIFKELI